MLSCDEQLIKNRDKIIAAVIPWVPSYRKIKKTIKTYKSKLLSIPLLLHRLLLGCPFNIHYPTSLYEIFHKLSHNFNFILILDVYVIPKLTN